MKILHIIDSLGLGGAQTVVKGIFESQKENKNLYLFCLRKREINININHPNVAIFDSKAKYSFGPIRNLKRIIEKEKIDILHCHLFRSQVFGWILKKYYFPNIKLIFHEHGRIFQDNFIYNLFMRISEKYVDKIIAVSKITKDKLIKKAGILENKIDVLPNFVDLKKFNRDNITWDNKEEKRKLGIKEDEFVIGFVGRLARVKGCEYLIKSLPYLDFSYKVLIAGDGPEKEKIEKLAKDLGVGGKVMFLGYRENAIFVYSLLDVLIVPSLSEASPMVLYETQAMEIPAIVSNVSGLNEVVKDNKNGLLFESKDYIDLAEKMKNLYPNNDLRKQLIENSLENVKKYSLEEYLINLNKTYYEK